MSVLKQLLVAAILLLVGIGGWYVAQNPQLLSFAAVAPQGDAGGEPQGRRGQGAEGRDAQGGRAGRIPGLRRGGVTNVVTAEVQTDRTDRSVAALGTAKAVRSVSIFPQASGIVAEVAFTPGTRVAEGALLIRLEDDEQRLAVDRAKLALDQARAALDRARQLAESKAISVVALSDAEMAVQLAEAELKGAEIAQSRREIRAPFPGVTGLTDVSAGDLVTSSAAIVSLDDLSTILVVFEVPERWVGRIAPGQTIAATARGLPGSTFSGKVTAVDSRVDEASRTLRMEAALANERGDLKPGMSVLVEIRLAGEERLGVPSLAVQWDRKGSYVWKIDGDAARRADVSVLSRMSDAVIVESADLVPGDKVVVEGVQRLREGAKVAVVGDDTIEAAPQAAAAPEAQAATEPEETPPAAAPAEPQAAMREDGTPPASVDRPAVPMPEPRPGGAIIGGEPPAQDGARASPARS